VEWVGLYAILKEEVVKTIEEYTVLATVYDVNLNHAVEHTRLEAQVNAKIAEGWQPYGDLIGVRGERSVIFAQPMVRYSED
jgi:hypothetical protein